jgi:hypothetical protein
VDQYTADKMALNQSSYRQINIELAQSGIFQFGHLNSDELDYLQSSISSCSTFILIFTVDTYRLCFSVVFQNEVFVRTLVCCSG